MVPLVDVTEACVLDGYTLELRFSDGRHGTYDMSPYLEKPMYRPLRSPAVFALARVEDGTVVWPGDIDVSPERLWSDCVVA